MLQTAIRAFALSLTSLAMAQGPTQAELKQRYDDLRAEPWMANAAWVTDFDAAKKEAEESGKVIFAYFTRSYAL